MTVTDLKPCPFCGSAAKMSGGVPNRHAAYVYCSGCGVETSAKMRADAAIAAWNTRAADTEAEGLRRDHQLGEIEITPAMVSAGAEVLRRHLDEDRLMGNDPRLVRELLEAALLGSTKR